MKEIIEVIDKERVVYIPGFVHRWREDIQEMNNLIQSKIIGKVHTVNVGWIRRNGVPRPGTWFTNRTF